MSLTYNLYSYDKSLLGWQTAWIFAFLTTTCDKHPQVGNELNSSIPLTLITQYHTDIHRAFDIGYVAICLIDFLLSTRMHHQPIPLSILNWLIGSKWNLITESNGFNCLPVDRIVINIIVCIHSSDVCAFFIVINVVHVTFIIVGTNEETNKYFQRV